MGDLPRSSGYPCGRRAERCEDVPFRQRAYGGHDGDAGQLREDRHLYEGIVDGKPAETFPMPVTPEMMARGQERFNVFCSPCHGRTGEGDGMIVQRGFRKPPSDQEDRLRNAPDVILLDLVLPDGNGMDLLRDLPRGSTTEVIVVTGHATLESSIEAIRRGASDYLLRPTLPQD